MGVPPELGSWLGGNTAVIQSLPGGAAHEVCTRGRGSSQFNPMFTFFLPHPLPLSWLPLKNCLGVHAAASNGWKRLLTLVAEPLEQLKPLRVPGAQASAQNREHGRVGLCSQLQWEQETHPGCGQTWKCSLWVNKTPRGQHRASHEQTHT